MFNCSNPNHDHGDSGDDNNPITFIFNAQREEADRQRATAEVTGHEVSSALLTMDREQLLAVRQIVASVVNSQNPAVISGYFIGRVVTLLDQKFGICPACNSKHDDPSELITEAPPVPEHVQARRNLDDAAEEESTPSWTWIGSTSEMKSFEVEAMKAYDLDDVRDWVTKKLIGFACVNCGQRYPTISDRMKQPPGVEGCSGCQQKAKFG